jgi:transposase
VVFEAIVFVLRTGCQWKALPAERFGSASAVHKRFLEWEKAGFFEVLWRAGLAEYDDFEGIAWRWQSLDAAMMKAPWPRSKSVRTPRIGEKNGSKRHLLVDGRGVPLSLVVTGAHRHDVTQLEAVLEAIEVKLAIPPQRRSQYRCADAAYRGAAAMTTIFAHGYIAHVKGRRPEARELERPPGKRARCWRLSKSRTVGSTGSASSSCAMKNSIVASSHSIIWPRRSLRSARCLWRFT